MQLRKPDPVFNALGQRVSKTGAALTTGGRVYVYDEAGHLIGEYDTTGARQHGNGVGLA